MNEHGDTTVTGPLSNGNILLQDADGLCFATVKNEPATGLASRRIAVILSRAFQMRAMLEQLTRGMQADDEGARWHDELESIRRELTLQDNRAANKPEPIQEVNATPRVDLQTRVQTYLKKQEMEKTDANSQSSAGVSVPHVRADSNPFEDDSAETPANG